MADIEQLRQLAERLEKATVADRELDYAVLSVAGYRDMGLSRRLQVSERCPYDDECVWLAPDHGWPGTRLNMRRPWVERGNLPHVTHSIDAALALVERRLPGQWRQVLASATNAAVNLTELPLAILRALVAALIAQAEATHG